MVSYELNAISPYSYVVCTLYGKCVSSYILCITEMSKFLKHL